MCRNIVNLVLKIKASFVLGILKLRCTQKKCHYHHNLQKDFLLSFKWLEESSF
jgi:hypothetical protein